MEAAVRPSSAIGCRTTVMLGRTRAAASKSSKAIKAIFSGIRTDRSCNSRTTSTPIALRVANMAVGAGVECRAKLS